MRASANPIVAVSSIVSAEGIGGLYKGYVVNVIKVAPASAITFLTYEMARQGLEWFAFRGAGPSTKQRAQTRAKPRTVR